MIPWELTPESATEVRDILFWAGMCEEMVTQLSRSGINLDLRKLTEKWKSMSGFIAAVRKDLPYFLAIYQYVYERREGAIEDFEDFMKNYYIRTSLKRNPNKENKKADEVNWQVACAIAIAEGLDENVAFKLYDIKEKEYIRVRNMVGKLAEKESVDPNDISPLYDQNARIVGRITMAQFIYKRLYIENVTGHYSNKADRILHVLGEALILMKLGMSPDDEDAEKVLSVLRGQ